MDQRPPPSSSGVGGFFTNLFKKVTFSSGIPTATGGLPSRQWRRSRAASIDQEGRSISPSTSEASLSNESNYALNDNIRIQRTDSLDSSDPYSFGARFPGRSSFNLSRDFWMRDDAVMECYDCKVPFNTFRRKHHCRICMLLCASNIVNGARFGYAEDLRVCDFCLRVTNDTDVADVPVIVGSPLSPRGRAFEESAQEASSKKLLAPFRVENDDMDDDMDLGSYAPEEAYSSFSVNQSQSDLAPSSRSFMKLSPDRSAFSDHEFQYRPRNSSLSMERKKSPALANRRKFSSRYMGGGVHTGGHLAAGRIAQIYPTSSPESLEAPVDAEVESFEMNLASVNHINLLIHQMLLKSGISTIEEWKKVILSLILKACSNLNPNVREGDEIDIRHYVKIKKIPGGTIADSHYLNGVVASKKVIHKQMLKPMKRAKILLLTFPLEYQRVENQFISLGTLIAQEKDHLKNLVGRLIALRPEIVMVEKTVARLALEFLLDANIIVIPNVKISLLSAVSRTTGADIVHSIDQLAIAKIGMCESFEFKTYIHNMIPEFRKAYLYVEGVANLGCTLVLRGSSKEELALIKDIVHFLVFAIYNLKLETSLFQDEYAMNPNVEEIADSASSPLTSESNPYDRAISLYKNVILSASPTVRFPVPFLLENRSKIAQEKANVPTTEVMEDSHIPLLLNAERMSPISHQNIIVLYSNNSPSTIIPCSPPRPHLIEYYRESDLTLGQFIEDSCLGSQSPCTVCEKTALVHYRTYSHGSAKVTVTVNPLPCPVSGMEGRIVMWSLCRICKESTPFIPMSETTWKYSFGKYLELTFYHLQLQSRTHSCKHDVHRDHMRYFSFQNLAVRFEFEEIILYDISGPPMNRKPKTESITKWRQQDAEAIKKQVTDYYTSVLERIQHFTYEIVSSSKLAACKEAMNELSKRATMEKKLLLQLLHQTLIESSPTDCLSFNQVYKSLQTNVLQWEQDFLAFIRTYLSTDAKEIRRMTAAQIKRIFVDKEPTIETRVSLFPRPTEPALKTGDIGDGELGGFPVIGQRMKLPTLDPELEDFHFYTSDTHRRMSHEWMAAASSGSHFPDLGSSPSIYANPGRIIPSPPFLANSDSRVVSFSENHDEVSFGSRSTYEPSFKTQEIETHSLRSPDARPARPRPKSIRFDEHTAFTPSSWKKKCNCLKRKYLRNGIQ